MGCGCVLDIHQIFLSIHWLLGTLVESCVAFVNSATIKMDVQLSLFYIDLHPFGYMP
jgi:hypothetical protein